MFCKYQRNNTRYWDVALYRTRLFVWMSDRLKERPKFAQTNFWFGSDTICNDPLENTANKFFLCKRKNSSVQRRAVIIRPSPPQPAHITTHVCFIQNELLCKSQSKNLSWLTFCVWIKKTLPINDFIHKEVNQTVT